MPGVNLGASDGLPGGPGICLFGLVVRRAGEFIQERQLREYEASLRKTVAERHPHLTEQERIQYNQRILDLVAERREEMARQKQQTPACWGQQQEQGIER